ncbi:MAG: hypothetical protein ACR2GD_12320 [Pyrinomonadaceae bacterium]
MKKIIYGAKTPKTFFFGLILVQIFSLAIFAQNSTGTKSQSEKNERSKTAAKEANLPTVTQIDAAALEKLLKPNGKPVLVNFWAT